MPGANPLWNEDTLGALLRRQARDRPDAPALLAGDARISWGVCRARRLADEGIAKFKWPERLELIEALPLTPTQKVMRGKLRELLRENR